MKKRTTKRIPAKTAKTAVKKQSGISYKVAIVTLVVIALAAYIVVAKTGNTIVTP